MRLYIHVICQYVMVYTFIGLLNVSNEGGGSTGSVVRFKPRVVNRYMYVDGIARSVNNEAHLQILGLHLIQLLN